jgi:tRNA pseudouridine38-40 synthase
MSSEGSTQAESSKRVLSRSPSPSEANGDSEHQAKRRALDKDTSGNGVASVDPKPSADVPKNGEESISNASSSSRPAQPRKDDLVGQGRRGYKGKGEGDRRGQFGTGTSDSKRDWHRGGKVNGRDGGTVGKGKEGEDNEDGDAGDDGDKIKRLPKKKVAILLG